MQYISTILTSEIYAVIKALTERGDKIVTLTPLEWKSEDRYVKVTAYLAIVEGVTVQKVKK